MLTRSEIFTKVQQMLVEKLGITEEQVTNESKIQDTLGADSLDVVDINMELEEMFDIVISEKTMESFETVEDVVEYLVEVVDKEQDEEQEDFDVSDYADEE